MLSDTHRSIVQVLTKTRDVAYHFSDNNIQRFSAILMHDKREEETVTIPEFRFCC